MANGESKRRKHAYEWSHFNASALEFLVTNRIFKCDFWTKLLTKANIALDENEQAWYQLVTTKKLPGVQVRVPAALRAQITAAYALQEVPTYMLVGEDGTFLNTKPRRLSSRAAVDEIEQSFGKAATYTNALDLPVSKK